MYDGPGSGSAAPQIGIRQRWLVKEGSKEGMETPQPMVLIRPRVIAAASDTNIDDEGCLSIPEQYAEVERPAVVKVEWMDLNGKTQQEEFADLWATCVQHEIDHLNGKLFTYYLTLSTRQSITPSTGQPTSASFWAIDRDLSSFGLSTSPVIIGSESGCRSSFNCNSLSRSHWL